MFPGHRIAKIPEIKQTLELAQKPASELLIGDVRKRDQEFDVPDQVSQTELLKRIGVFDISGEKVTDDRALEGFSEDSL